MRWAGRVAPLRRLCGDPAPLGSSHLCCRLWQRPAQQQCRVALAGGAPEARPWWSAFAPFSTLAPSPSPAAPPQAPFILFIRTRGLSALCRRQFICSVSLAAALRSPAPAPSPLDFTTCTPPKRNTTLFLPPSRFRQQKKTKNLLWVYPGSPALLCSHLIIHLPHPLFSSACYLMRAGSGRAPQAPPPPPARVRQPCAPHFERTAPVPRPLAFLPVPLTPDTPACVTPNPPQSLGSAHARCPSRTVPRSSPAPSPEACPSATPLT